MDVFFSMSYRAGGRVRQGFLFRKGCYSIVCWERWHSLLPLCLILSSRILFLIHYLVTLSLYFSILKKLREKGLTQKISVDEVLFELSKVMLIREKNGREYLAKIPKRAQRMISLFPEALHMG